MIRRDFLKAAAVAQAGAGHAHAQAPRLGKRDYVDQFRYWFARMDRGWDERKGLYVFADAGVGVEGNASMLPCLAVLGLEGDSRLARRIPRILEHLITSPPWDPEYHYWNQAFDRLGMEPHPGSWMGSYLAVTYMCRKELGLPSDLLEKAMDLVELYTAMRAEDAKRARAFPFPCYLDEKGKIADAGALRREAVRRGMPEDMRRLRRAGPTNQLAQLDAAELAYLATRREAFWDHARLMWGQIIEAQQDGKPLLFRSCMDPDYSFIYASDRGGGIHTHRYTQSVYALGFLSIHANAVRIARKVGRSEPAWEEMVRRFAQALFGREFLRDGTCNLVLNSYGWERSIIGDYLVPYLLLPLIPIADLAPVTAGQLKSMIDGSLVTLRVLEEMRPPSYFAPALGLKGFHRGPHTPFQLALQLAEMIIANPEAMEVEEAPKDLPRCYSGFAWAQKHLVFQAPAYSLTLVGAGPPYIEDKGQLGSGLVTSGGEYVLKVPDGPFLTPLSNHAKTLLSARAGNEDIRSSDIHFFNRDAYGFRMEVILPDGTRISRGEDFGPPPYDPMLEKLSVEVSYGKGPARLMRRFDLSPDAVGITDSLQALDEVEVGPCFSRLPIITVGPDGQTVALKGMAGGRPLEIKPPVYMGYAGDILYYDQDFIQSLRGLERLEATYPSGHGFVFETVSRGPMRLAISRGEWQENRRMRVDGKNLDFYWIDRPTRLAKGDSRSFSYRIVPASRQSG